MRERRIGALGLDVQAAVWGTGDVPVVLVHGLGASTISWEPVAPRLAAAIGATVTAVDLAGFGLTRLGRGRRASVGENARLLEALLSDHLGPDALVIGNSMGAAIAVRVAARRPELARALVLVDPALPRHGAGLAPWQVMARFAPMMVPQLGTVFARSRARMLGPARLVDGTLAWTFARTDRIDPVLRERLVERAAERAAFAEAPRAYSEAARSLLVYLQTGIAADLERLTGPVLVVHGALDRLVPLGAARALVARRPDFDIEVIDDCGHAPQMELPDQFVEVVGRWVASLPERSRLSEDR